MPAAKTKGVRLILDSVIIALKQTAESPESTIEASLPACLPVSQPVMPPGYRPILPAYALFHPPPSHGALPPLRTLPSRRPMTPYCRFRAHAAHRCGYQVSLIPSNIEQEERLMIINVSTIDDPRLDAYARLTEVQLRNKLEPEKGMFIAESSKVIERAVAGGMQPLSLLMEEKFLPGMEPIIEQIKQRYLDFDLPVFILPHGELKQLTGFELTRGALGAFRRPIAASVEEVCRDARRVAVLEDITNHTNVGAIFRSAAALGIDAVLVTQACYDPLYRRAVRVSMGTVFQVPWARIGADSGATGAGSWAHDGIPLLHSLGFKTAALALSDDSVSIDDPQLASEERLALVLGTEGDGLASSTIANCDYTVRIPMAHGVDSLNVAAASAVAFWELRAK
ncbi:MAG: TrmH family RNA methyltransferase [Senegalimassilia anaerobia]